MKEGKESFKNFVLNHKKKIENGKYDLKSATQAANYIFGNLKKENTNSKVWKELYEEFINSKIEPSIDEFYFQKYFQKFITFIEEKSGMELKSFSSNIYTENEEGYKDNIYRESRNILDLKSWKEKDIGSGKFMERLKEVFKIKNNNLITSKRFTLPKILDKLNEINKLEFENILFNFYLNKVEDKISFEKIKDIFVSNYSILGFLFFLKDKNEYMPISPESFDEAFKKLGVEDFKTSHRASFENYLIFNKLLKEVQILIEKEGVQHVSLLDAHSFVWIINNQFWKIEKDLEKDFKEYKNLNKKEKEVLVKSRLGQGDWRKRVLNIWNKGVLIEVEDQSLLIASHIKPWRNSSVEEALDKYNGFPLTPNLDKLFDKGLISFKESGEILISTFLSLKDRESLNINNNLKIKNLKENNLPYLKYHREKIFKKDVKK